jgi:hypothetical protein
MIGKFKIKKVDKSTGDSEVVYEGTNQITEGLKHSIVNVLTGTGSDKIEDYKFAYFQLGNKKYDLSTYDISGDLTSSEFKSYFWTLKSPLTKLQYGNNSKHGIVSTNARVLGSLYGSGTGITKAVDNFVEPPETRTVVNEYTNIFAIPPTGEDQQLNTSSIWFTGCADNYQLDPDNFLVQPLEPSADYTMSGPDFKTPTWAFSYTTTRDLEKGSGKNYFDTICVRANHGYIYNNDVDNPLHEKGKEMTIYQKLKKHQTLSAYFNGKHYASGTAELSSTVLTGRIQYFNRFAQAFIHTQAGRNNVDFLYRYDYSNPNATYTPSALTVSSGWENYVDLSGEEKAVSNFGDTFGVFSKDEYGVVSGNVWNKYGPVYTYDDHLNNYVSGSGPGADYMDTSNVGFGPSGNFYRVSVSWTNASDKMVDWYLGLANGSEFEGNGLVPFFFPIVSSVSGYDLANPNALTGTYEQGIVGHAKPETTPRSLARLAFFQWDLAPSASPNQYVHGEQSLYITYPQVFVNIPPENSTTLVDNTVNVRLEADEDLATSQSFEEVGLFIKNPSGKAGSDIPYLVAYKTLEYPINKTNEFSYIIDWEISLFDA